MEITVHPDKTVLVKVPLGTDPGEVVRRVQKRAGWIKRQMLYFDQLEPRTPPRRYVGGESHPYLGRKYRLKIKKSGDRQVLLKNGYFHVQSPDPSSDNVQKLLEEWYYRKAATCFQAIFHLCWEKFKKNDAPKPRLKIRKMKTRWGSMSTSGNLTLNLELIKTPKQCIEYVIVHELCHLLHRNHGAEFYRLLERSLPDWTQRKHKLERALI